MNTMAELDRRKSDIKLDEILAAHRSHIADFHANLKPGEALTIVETVRKNHEELKRRGPLFDLLVEEVVGKEVHDPVTGDLIGREPSLRSIVAELEHRSNGGGGVSVSWGSKIGIGIISSVISGVFLILTAVVTGVLT